MVACEAIHGLMAQVVKEGLFNMAKSEISPPEGSGLPPLESSMDPADD